MTQTSEKILSSFKKQAEKDSLQVQLDEINRRWSLLRKKSLEIRSRLESNSAQWAALLSSLKELIHWCKVQQQEIAIRRQSLQPDLNLVYKQINENKVFMCNVEYKKSIIESTLASAKLYYDDRLKNIEQATKESVSTTLPQTTVTTAGSGGVVATGSAAATSPSSIGSTFFGLKRRLSSSSKKNTKAKNVVLQIKEETDKEGNEPATENAENVVDSSAGQSITSPAAVDDLDLDDELDFFSSQMSPQEVAAQLVNKIDKKVQLLDRLWQELNRQSLGYNNLLVNFYQNLQLLNKSYDLVNQKLNENEQELNTMSNGGSAISEIESDKLADELEKVKQFQLKVNSCQPMIDNMCNHYTNIMQDLQQSDALCLKTNNKFNTNGTANAASNTTALSSMCSKFDDLNLRWTNLQNQLQENYLHIYSLIESSGADIFLKLVDSVQSPWQRGLSANKVPYYIKYIYHSFFGRLFVLFMLNISSHATEKTSWDHPRMIELYNSFTSLNDIQFCAYRTAMKLRTLQKRLWRKIL